MHSSTLLQKHPCYFCTYDYRNEISIIHDKADERRTKRPSSRNRPQFENSIIFELEVKSKSNLVCSSSSKNPNQKEKHKLPYRTYGYIELLLMKYTSLSFHFPTSKTTQTAYAKDPYRVFCSMTSLADTKRWWI